MSSIAATIGAGVTSESPLHGGTVFIGDYCKNSKGSKGDCAGPDCCTGAGGQKRGMMSNCGQVGIATGRMKRLSVKTRDDGPCKEVQK